MCYNIIGKRKGKVLKMFYWFIFEDGYRVACRGMSGAELKIESRKHGKLLRKVMV